MSLFSEVRILSDGYFTLDTGAIFGIVPRPIWSKFTTANQNSRVKLALNIPLITNRSFSAMVDSGIGKMQDEKFRKIFEVEEASDFLDQVSESIEPKNLNYLVHSHLHFDHMGHSFGLSGSPEFPNATIVAQADEFSGMKHPNELTKNNYRGYPKRRGKQRISAVEGSIRIKDGLSVIKTGGHTRGHQVVIYRSGAEELIYFGDLIPSSFHLRLPYITAIDNYPIDTLYWKKKLISKAIRDHAVCIFNHDVDTKAAYLSGDTANPRVEKVDL
jgi:glyoxylase-like metal-dependent hydrolase (beta-lactamase superfamily II)